LPNTWREHYREISGWPTTDEAPCLLLRRL
jgi:hypothetical protein